MNSWKMHHVGIATRDLSGLLARFEMVGFDLERNFRDAKHGIDGAFLTRGNLRVEVLTPLADSPILEPWLASGNRIYQIAVEVSDLESEISSVLAHGGRLVREPLSAVAFDGRRVAFVMIGIGFLLELIESA